MKFVLLFFIFLVSAASFDQSFLFAQTSEAELQGVDQKLVLLETKVSRLKIIQEEIAKKQIEIKQELDSLKIWIRKNRS